jgi:hypothetical protein
LSWTIANVRNIQSAEILQPADSSIAGTVLFPASFDNPAAADFQHTAALAQLGVVVQVIA